MRRSIIYLVGFMGAGKTSVGQRLAKMLGWRFVDLDQVIEEREGRPIRDIFRDSGEPYFREIERRELAQASSQNETVVALGGGAFCNDQNRQAVQESGISVWLDAPIDILYARCAGQDTRPLHTTREKMESLLELRRPLYAKADLQIDAGERAIDAIAEDILRSLRSPIISANHGEAAKKA
jgi:shikimate kinase